MRDMSTEMFRPPGVANIISDISSVGNIRLLVLGRIGIDIIVAFGVLSFAGGSGAKGFIFPHPRKLVASALSDLVSGEVSSS